MVKKGDTLIEVTLAIGIFSMVAVSIVAVMSGGTATAQTSLETTLAREEIDAQAEALRFIHNAAVAEKTAATQPFYELWEKIVKLAFNNKNTGSGNLPDSELNYAPATCADLYDKTKNEAYDKMFVIDYRQFNQFIENPKITDILITNDSGKLTQTTTYPRLVFGNSFGTTEEETLINDPNDTLVSAEGIYIVGAAADINASVPEYYDFYIRSCWYGISSETPSTVSTVIRLYNPDAVSN